MLFGFIVINLLIFIKISFGERMRWLELVINLMLFLKIYDKEVL